METDYSSIIGTIIQKKPDLLLNGIGGPPYAAFVKQAQQFNLFKSMKFAGTYIIRVRCHLIIWSELSDWFDVRDLGPILSEHASDDRVHSRVLKGCQSVSRGNNFNVLYVSFSPGSGDTEGWWCRSPGPLVNALENVSSIHLSVR